MFQLTLFLPCCYFLTATNDGNANQHHKLQQIESINDELAVFLSLKAKMANKASKNGYCMEVHEKYYEGIVAEW